MPVCDDRSILGAGQVDTALYSERRNLESQTLSLSLRRHSLTHSFDIEQSRDFYVISTHHPGGSQSGSIYRWKIEAKISVSVSIFLDF